MITKKRLLFVVLGVSVFAGFIVSYRITLENNRSQAKKVAAQTEAIFLNAEPLSLQSNLLALESGYRSSGPVIALSNTRAFEACDGKLGSVCKYLPIVSTNNFFKSLVQKVKGISFSECSAENPLCQWKSLHTYLNKTGAFSFLNWHTKNIICQQSGYNSGDCAGRPIAEITELKLDGVDGLASNLDFGDRFTVRAGLAEGLLPKKISVDVKIRSCALGFWHCFIAKTFENWDSLDVNGVGTNYHVANLDFGPGKYTIVAIKDSDSTDFTSVNTSFVVGDYSVGMKLGALLFPIEDGSPDGGGDIPPLNPAPYVSLYGPSSVRPGENVTLSWSSLNVSANCTASGGWDGSKSPEGTENVVIPMGTPAGAMEFSLTCSNYSGTDSASIIVEIRSPLTGEPSPSPEPGESQAPEPPEEECPWWQEILRLCASEPESTPLPPTPEPEEQPQGIQGGPIITINLPASDIVPKTFTVSATAQDQSGSGIAKITIYFDGVLQETCGDQDSCSVDIETIAGPHTIEVNAKDRSLPLPIVSSVTKSITAFKPRDIGLDGGPTAQPTPSPDQCGFFEGLLGGCPTPTPGGQTGEPEPRILPANPQLTSVQKLEVILLDKFLSLSSNAGISQKPGGLFNVAHAKGPAGCADCPPVIRGPGIIGAIIIFPSEGLLNDVVKNPSGPVGGTFYSPGNLAWYAEHRPTEPILVFLEKMGLYDPVTKKFVSEIESGGALVGLTESLVHEYSHAAYEFLEEVRAWTEAVYAELGYEEKIGFFTWLISKNLYDHVIKETGEIDSSHLYTEFLAYGIETALDAEGNPLSKDEIIQLFKGHPEFCTLVDETGSYIVFKLGQSEIKFDKINYNIDIIIRDADGKIIKTASTNFGVFFQDNPPVQTTLVLVKGHLIKIILFQDGQIGAYDFTTGAELPHTSVGDVNVIAMPDGTWVMTNGSGFVVVVQPVLNPDGTPVLNPDGTIKTEIAALYPALDSNIPGLPIGTACLSPQPNPDGSIRCTMTDGSTLTIRPGATSFLTISRDPITQEVCYQMGTMMWCGDRMVNLGDGWGGHNPFDASSSNPFCGDPSFLYSGFCSGSGSYGGGGGSGGGDCVKFEGGVLFCPSATIPKKTN